MERKFTEKIKKSLNRLAGYAIWILIILLAFSIVRNIGGAGRVEAEIEAERAKVEKMKEDNKKLQEEIAQSQGDAFVEKQIRDKLGLVKEGDVIVVLPDSDVLRQLAPQSPEENDTLPEANWKRWLKLFL